MTCPAGHTAPIRTEPSGQRRATFAKALCDACPLRERCVAPARGSRQVPIAGDEAHLIAARQALDDPAQAEHLRRTRPRIERLLGLLAIRYGARKTHFFRRLLAGERKHVRGREDLRRKHRQPAEPLAGYPQASVQRAARW